MKKQPLFTAVLSALLTMGAAVNAAATSAAFNNHASGWYIKGSVGGNKVQDEAFSTTALGITSGGEVNYDWGWAAGVEVGKKRGPARLGVAIDYFKSDIDKITAGAAGSFKGEGQAFSALLTFTYDVFTGERAAVYTGLGIGAIVVDIDISDFGSHDDTVFSYHNVVGVRYPVNDNTLAFFEFRHVGSSRLDVHGIELYYQANTFNIGLDYLF